jgi:hypothetical protein
MVYFFLGNENQTLNLNLNGATRYTSFSSIIPCIVSSAGEAEYYAALFAGAQQATSLRTITILYCNCKLKLLLPLRLTRELYQLKLTTATVMYVCIGVHLFTTHSV